MIVLYKDFLPPLSMFDRPDADYLQDLLAGYVLGHLDPTELRYLQRQISQDPQLQQVLYQLEHALGSLSEQSQPYNPQITVPLVQAQMAYLPVFAGSTSAVPRRTARRIVIGSGLAAAIAMAVGLPWLLSRNRFSELLSKPITSSPESVETINALQAWTGLQALIHDHANADHSEDTPINLASEEAEQMLTTLRNYMPEADKIIVLAHPQAQLLGGSHYEQTQLQGIRFTYQLNQQTLVSVYQLRIGLNHSLEFPPKGNFYVDSEDDINLVLWRQGHILYSIVAELPISELQQLVQSTQLH